MAVEYKVSVDELTRINENKDMEALGGLGGVPGLAEMLSVDVHKGLEPEGSGADSVENHRTAFGANKYKEVPPKSFFLLVWENLQDTIILILMAAALVSTILGAALPESREENAWLEGVAIWIAVVAVTAVGAGNDWSKDQQFRKLNAQKDLIEIKVIRGGKSTLVLNPDIVVGDIMILDQGDKIIADGVVIDSQGLVLDEASLTGESDPVKKNEQDPWIRSGTTVSEGSGKMLVVAVGERSEWGKTLGLIADAGDDQTPLQVLLDGLATAIGYFGIAVAVSCFIALLIEWCVENNGFPISEINNDGPIQFFLYSVTIIVVAIPEGLPLAVTISLAYSMKKMMKDNNFVRQLAACETMGGATAICSDKTGTLTENRMTVTEAWFFGSKLDSIPETPPLRPADLNILVNNAALTSQAFLTEEKTKTGEVRTGFVGNRTDCALLLLLRSWGFSYEKIREEHESLRVRKFDFTSARKMASYLVKQGDGYRLYNKGAAEWVLQRCEFQYDEYGQVVPMTASSREQLLEIVTNMAKRGLRCICLTYKDMPAQDPSRGPDWTEDVDALNQHLIACAIVGIKDPVRKEVPAAVETCKRAGITVRMVTGDNIFTAKHIARECGILTSEEQECLEGPVFREMNEETLIPLLPRLRVLARSSPEDKLMLVRALKKQGEIVAVTGDGTNDAPALKESHVGLAMGIAGTEVAKEAADIVIMDDNFSSIVKAVLWGRSVFANIQKFLQFQLTVNCVCLIAAFVGALVGGHEPLTLMQLLWVNLIMDTMGALALATEEPHPDLLLAQPKRKVVLITKTMWKHIFVISMYQLFWMMFWLYYAPRELSEYYVIGEEEYYSQYCVEDLMDNYGLPNTTDPVNGAQYYCGIMNYCGFPENEAARQTPACPLYGNWTLLNPNSTEPVPGDQNIAVCWGNTTCTANDNLNNYIDYVENQYEDERDDDYKLPLTMLFNSFIMVQIVNEICARRINDEINVFQNIHKGPIFIAVIVVTLGFQAIIVELLGFIFTCTGLSGEQWGICFAIGLGLFPVSIGLRIISQLAKRYCCKPREEGSGRRNPVTNDSGHIALSGTPSETITVAPKPMAAEATSSHS